MGVEAEAKAEVATTPGDEADGEALPLPLRALLILAEGEWCERGCRAIWG